LDMFGRFEAEIVGVEVGKIDHPTQENKKEPKEEKGYELKALLVFVH